MKNDKLFSLTKRKNICKRLWVLVLILFKRMGKNIGKNIRKSLNSKYSQNRLDHAKQSATDALKTSSQRVIKKAV